MCFLFLFPFCMPSIISPCPFFYKLLELVPFSYFNHRNGSGVIATLGLLFTKDAPGHLDPLTRALLAGKIGDMPVASKYESAGKNKAALYYEYRGIIARLPYLYKYRFYYTTRTSMFNHHSKATTSHKRPPITPNV